MAALLTSQQNQTKRRRAVSGSADRLQISREVLAERVPMRHVLVDVRQRQSTPGLCSNLGRNGQRPCPVAGQQQEKQRVRSMAPRRSANRAGQKPLSASDDTSSADGVRRRTRRRLEHPLHNAPPRTTLPRPPRTTLRRRRSAHARSHTFVVMTPWPPSQAAAVVPAVCHWPAA